MMGMNWGNIYPGFGFGAPIKGDPNIALNQLDYDIDFEALLDIFLARFKWTVVPVLQEKYAWNNYIERILFWQGMAGVIKTRHGILVLPATPQGMNSYGEPTGYILYTYGASDFGPDFDGSRSRMLQKWFQTNKPKDLAKLMSESEDEVFDDMGDGETIFYRPRNRVAIIRDKQSSAIPICTAQRFALKTSDMRRSEEVYARGWKNPTVINVLAANKNTAKALGAEIQKNKDIIVNYMTPKEAEARNVQLRAEALNTGHRASELKEFMTARRQLFNECLEYMGICVSSDIGSTQVETNNGLSFARMQFENARQSRLDGIRQAKKMFGLELKFTETDANDQLLMLDNNSAPGLPGKEKQQDMKELDKPASQRKPVVDTPETHD